MKSRRALIVAKARATVTLVCCVNCGSRYVVRCVLCGAFVCPDCALEHLKNEASD